MTNEEYPGLLQAGLDLPVLVADDDFIEHLHENGHIESLEIDELIFEYIDWAKENVDE